MKRKFKLRSMLQTGLLGFVLAGCAAVNEPLNDVLTGNVSSRRDINSAAGLGLTDDVFIGLAFSGGGTRASAFAYGLLQELRATNRDADHPNGLLDHVKLVSGVSGGSVTAAYYGLYGPAGLNTYRDRYLIRDAETYMANTAYNPITIVKGVSGGANDRTTFARFLDEVLFKNATFADLGRRNSILTMINASDIANNTPFLFARETFDALCSDLRTFPISEAVAASAAVPLVFSPIVLKSHSESCNYREPDWLTSARNNPEATSALRAYAKALESYQDPKKVKYVKLLDGSVTDNFGTTGLTLERAKSQNAYGPLSPQDTVKLKRILFLVANAGVSTDYSWTQQVKGPGGPSLALAISNSSMGAATRVGYDVMRLTMQDWFHDLIEYRCELTPLEVKRYGGDPADWDCNDLKLFVGEVSFDGLPRAMEEQLNTIPTRLRLPVEQVDLVIKAARLSAKQNPEFNGFLRSMTEIDLEHGLGDARDQKPRLITPIQN